MISVQIYSPEHEQGVVHLILPIQQTEFGVPIKLEDQPDLLDIPGFYQKGNGNFWIALHDDEVIGTIGLLDIGNRQGALRKMFVHAAFRGKEHGVARQLLHALLDWSRRYAMHDIFLGTTAKYLAAHRFYEKNGFTDIPKESLPPAFPVMSVDTKFYMCQPGASQPDSA